MQELPLRPSPEEYGGRTIYFAAGWYLQRQSTGGETTGLSECGSLDGRQGKVDLQERYSAIFDQFLFDIRSWINLDKLADHQGGNSAEYASWFALVSFLMYGNYEFEKSDEEFLEMLQENICSIQKVCEETVEMCNGRIDLRPRK